MKASSVPAVGLEVNIMAKNQYKRTKLRTPRWLEIEQLFVRRRQKSLYGSLMMGRLSQDLAPQVIYFTG